MAMCEKRIPIYPVRYTVIAREGLDAYNYGNSKDLETGYPELKHSTYTLRLLREGFVYIYDANKGDKSGLQLWKVNSEGTFTELTSLTRIPSNSTKQYKEGNTHNYISASDQSTEVYVGFTDTLWTEKVYSKIVSNEGKICDSLMTKINVKQWAGTEQADKTYNGTQEGKHTFPATKLQQNLEEYKNFMENLAWSKRTATLPFKEPDALKGVMSATAKHAQIIVALHDNIGLVEDQKMLIHHYKADHAIYTQNNHRKKLIADLIDQVYTQEFATANNIRGGQQALNQAINQKVNLNKQSYERLSHYLSPEYTTRGHTGHNNRARATRAKERQPHSYAGYRSEVLLQSAERQAKHVDEAKRLKFLNRYNKKTKALLKIVIEAKNDRCKLLKTYTKISKPTDLGSAFLTYDKENPISGGAHAQAFANITEGMMADVSVVSGVKNCEHDLFDQWWQKPLADNPQLVNLRLDDNLLVHVLKNKPDTIASIVAGSDAVGTMFSPNFATSEITHNLVVYTLTKDPKWRGAVLNNIDAMFQKMLNAPTEAHAKELRTILEGNHQKLSGNYKAATSIEMLSPKEFAKKFGAGAKVTEGAVERILHSSGGGLKGKQAVFNIVHTQDQSKLKYLLDNPFGGKVSGAVSVLALVLFAFNLKVGIATFKRDKNLENFFNLGSAVFGLGSGINAMAMALKPIIGTQAYARYVTHYAIARNLASVGMMRFFGYGGAIIEGITQSIRSFKAHSVGDTDAGNFYAMAAVALTAGGIIVTKASIAMGAAITSGAALAAMIPIAGWIVAGILLLGLGIWAYIKANKAIDTPMEKWLDSSSFGLHGRTDSTTFKTEKEEHNAFVGALYAPQILSNSWNHEMIGKEDVTFEVYQPAKDKEYRFAIKPGVSRPKIDTTIRKRQYAEMRPWNPDGYHTTVEDFEHAGNGFRYKMHVKNIPKDTTVLTGCLYYIPMLSDDANHWVKHCFQIDRGWGWGSDVKTLPSN